ncbi:hypothetical protein O3M35_004994 [Rhynocoris fuscipes]|uniref:Transcription factor Adf-1 n=1 Tax=Rhynocoris fuscipes TaxID=488301 RepID=A0AAW1DH43_9HEMI
MRTDGGIMSEAKVLFTVSEDEKLVQMVSKFPCIYDVYSLLYKAHSVKENAWKEIAEYVGRSVEDCKKRWRNIKDTHLKRQKKISAENAVSNKAKKWRLADMLTFLNQVDLKRESLSNVEETHGLHNQLKVSELIKQEKSQTPPTSLTKKSPSQTIEYIPSVIQPTKRLRLDDKISALLNSQRIEKESKTLVDESQRQEEDGERKIQEKSQTSSNSQNMEHTLSFSRLSSSIPAQKNDKLLELLNSQRIERETILKKMVEEMQEDDVDLFFKSIAFSVKKLSPNLINEAKMRSLQMVIDLENHNSLAYNYPLPTLTSPCTYSRSNSPTPSTDDTKPLTNCD